MTTKKWKWIVALLVAIAMILVFISNEASTQSTSQITPLGAFRYGIINYGSTRLVPVGLVGADNLLIPTARNVVGTVFALSGTAKITRIQPGAVGQVVMLWTTSTDTLVKGVNLQIASTFNGTAKNGICLIYSATGAAADTFWTEMWRTAN